MPVLLLVLAMDWGRPAAKAPTVTLANEASWEYGLLEYSYRKDGYHYLFCRATAAAFSISSALPLSDDRLRGVHTLDRAVSFD
jgi:hypothetical protein